MTNASLADFLNAELQLSGDQTVTVDVIRQWVGWQVLPKASAQGRTIGQGPAWERDTGAMAIAVRLAELRKIGIRRKNAVIAQAHLEFDHVPQTIARGALISEFVKYRKQLVRGQTTFFDGSEYEHLSVTKQKAISNQLGQLDPRLANTQFDLGPELYAQWSEVAQFTEANKAKLETLVKSAIGQISPVLEPFIHTSLISTIVEALSGFTGSPDEIENSGQQALELASDEQFESARRLAQVLLALLRSYLKIQSHKVDANNGGLFGTLQAVGPQISVGPWAIFGFALIVQASVARPER